jgi:NADH dehydrogenase
MAALKSLRRRGVDVRLGARASLITAHGVTLADGSTLLACTRIGTIGTRPNALAAALGLPAERGRIQVNGDLSVPGAPGVWALGDCAAVPNAHDGQLAPPTAQFAVREGCLLAQNIRAALAGRPTRSFRHKPLGAMASIGHMKGVAQVFGLPLSGLAAWLLWRAYYLSQMPTLGRKLRIFVEWTWGMFFPTDVTHLRFPGSHSVMKAESDGLDTVAADVSPLRG